VVRFDFVRAAGKDGDNEDAEDLNEFTIHPEGEQLRPYHDAMRFCFVSLIVTLAFIDFVHERMGK